MFVVATPGAMRRPFAIDGIGQAIKGYGISDILNMELANHGVVVG